MKLIGAPGAPMTVLTEQIINTSAAMILNNLHLTVRQLALLLDQLFLLLPIKKNEKWRKELIKIDFLHVFKLGSKRPQKIFQE